MGEKKETTLTNKEIALRLVEAWVGQIGAPARMDLVLENYDKALRHLQNLSD